MPEGDTIWLAAQRLHAALQGEELTRSEFRVPQLATADLTGYVVQEVVPRGKHLLMRTERDANRLTLRSHLRMDGTWHIYTIGQQWRGGPQHWIRAVLATAHHEVVGYRLSMLAIVPTESESTLVGHLGPDILEPNPQFDLMTARVRNAPQRPLAEALLDQRVLAGLGTNLIAETCFVLGIHPGTPVADVDVDKVLRKARQIAALNAPRASRVTTGDPMRPAWVHGRRTCLRCSERLQRIAVGAGPQRRTLAYCPHCQPGR